MSSEVRAMRDDELVDWIAVMHTAFHANRSAAEEAEHRRQVRAADYDPSRVLAAVEDGRVVGTYQSFATQLSLPGEGACVPTDAVTAVSVLPTHRRRGHLSRMLRSDLEAARERGEIASVLIAAEFPIYGRFGYGCTTYTAAYQLETAAAHFPRTAPGTVDLIEPQRMRQLAPPIFDHMRRVRPGQIERNPTRWDVRVGLRHWPWDTSHTITRCALYSSPAGEPTGFALYRVEADWHHNVPTARLELDDLVALDADAYLGLWRFLSEIDLVSQITAEMRPLDEPLPWLLHDARKALTQTYRVDFLWLRALDTPRLLEARHYLAEAELMLEIDDPLRLSGGRFTLQASPDGAHCQPTRRSPDLKLGMAALGAAILGGTSLHMLGMAGLVEELTPGSLERAARLFSWPISPWCSTFF